MVKCAIFFVVESRTIPLLHTATLLYCCSSNKFVRNFIPGVPFGDFGVIVVVSVEGTDGVGVVVRVVVVC